MTEAAAYNIQRELFSALHVSNREEALLSSGIGKVVLYYTKSKRPEMTIKRIAEAPGGRVVKTNLEAK